MEAAAKVDFSKVVDQETLSKITAGGEEAATAFLTALNRTAQQVYGQSAVTTAKIVQQAVANAREDFQKELPDVIKRQGARTAVFEQNPAFQNPAVAPLIEAQVSQLALKYPKASQSELVGMAKEYLTQVASLINPPKGDASPKGKTTKAEDDWADYLN
jgi:hypothetical protein